MNLEEFKKQSGIRESAPLTSASFSTKSADDAKYGTDAFGVASKYADKFLRGTKDVFVGIGKQAANTVLGVSRLGERYLMNPLTGGAFAKNKFSADVVESALPAGALEQKNLAQKAGGLLFDIGSFAIPSTGVAKIATRLGRATGTALKAGGTVEKVANLAQKATTLGGISAGEGLLGTAYGAIQEGQLNKEALTQGAYGAILPVAFAGAGKVLGAAGDLIKFGATKASGLERETVEQIIKGKVPKEAMEEVNRQSLTRKVGDALLEERNALRDTGQAYNELRNAGEGMARVEMGAFQDVIDKYKLSIKNGKLVQTADTLPMSDTDLNQINKFFQTYSGDLDANKFLNARQFLAEEAQYDKLLAMTGKSKTGSQLAADLRSSLNKQADNFTVGNKTLGKIDAEYAPMKRDLDDVYKKIIDKDGELKDSAYSVVANLTGDAKTSVLASLKKYIPDIDEQVRVLKAVEDIARTMNTKTGTYVASILQGGGVLSSVATGNPAFLLTLLANPKFIIPMLRWYGAVVGKSNAFVQAVMRKILGGEALDQAETKFVQETLETAMKKSNGSKKLLTTAQPKKTTFLQKVKGEFTNPAYDVNKLKPGQKIPEGYSKLKTALKDNRGMQATGVSDDLVNEAKKYKSADEFIKNQTTQKRIQISKIAREAGATEKEVGEFLYKQANSENIKPAFHGTNQTFDSFEIGNVKSTGSKSADEAIFFTNNKIEADTYARLANKKISSQEKLLQSETKRLQGEIEQARKNGNWKKYEMKTEELENLEEKLLRSDKEVKNIYERDIDISNFKKIDMSKEDSFDLDLTQKLKTAKKEGYDGVVFENIKDPASYDVALPATTHYAVFKTDKILSKTKSQLTEIWNKANPKKLKKVYHGTNSDFDSFDLDKFERGSFGKAVYLTDDKAVAEYYGKNIKEFDIADDLNLYKSDTAKIKEADFEVARDLYKKKNGKELKIDKTGLSEGVSDVRAFWRGDTKEIQEAKNLFGEYLKKKGYDGVIEGDTIAIFEPKKLTTPKTNKATAKKLKK